MRNTAKNPNWNKRKHGIYDKFTIKNNIALDLLLEMM